MLETQLLNLHRYQTPRAYILPINEVKELVQLERSLWNLWQFNICGARDQSEPDMPAVPYDRGGRHLWTWALTDLPSARAAWATDGGWQPPRLLAAVALPHGTARLSSTALSIVDIPSPPPYLCICCIRRGISNVRHEGGGISTILVFYERRRGRLYNDTLYIGDSTVVDRVYLWLQVHIRGSTKSFLKHCIDCLLANSLKNRAGV